MTYTKYILPLVLSLFLSIVSQAQDRIHKKSGNIIESKVKEINTKTIVYKRFDNPEGPDYTINKSDVSKIIFQNGTEEKMETETTIINTTTTPVAPATSTVTNIAPAVQEIPKPKTVYGKNIISIAPLWLSNSSTFGLGLQYERVLDKNAILSFYLPVLYATITQRYYNASKEANDAQGYMVWVYPGIKVYPMGSNRRVAYGVGPSVAIGSGQVPLINRTTTIETVYDPDYGYKQEYVTTETASTKNKFQIGLIINNSINIQATKNIHIGTEFGLGFPYTINAADRDDDYTETPLVQFNFNMGYRF